MGLLALLTLLVVSRNRLAVHVYLSRTHDLDRHWCDDLLRLRPLKLDGVTVLSDPYTSYFARGMLGVRPLVVPAGVASPAVDHDTRELLACAALKSGTLPGFLADARAIIVERRNGLTQWFTGETPEIIRARWIAKNWLVW